MARCIDVSRDAVAQAERRRPTRATPGSVPRQSAARLLPPIWRAFSLNQTEMIVDGRREALLPGMAVTAEVKTGRRTIIDYLLSPLARKGNEALHER